MTVRLYHEDAYVLDFEAIVVSQTEREGRPAVVLDRTAFYPEGGGQPWDTGTLEGVPVRAVVEVSGDVFHLLDRPLEATHVHGHVDGERRRDHRQQHHGQHLLSRALVEMAQANTVSFHLGGDASSVDLDRTVSEELLEAAGRRANEVVWEARPVTTQVVTRSRAEALGIDVPPDTGPHVRLVEAEGFDLQPCGGTHPTNTAEVGVVVVQVGERYKGGTRVHFVCGHRALRLLGEQRRALQELKRVFSSPLEGLAAAAEKTALQLAETRREVRNLADRAVLSEAALLLASTEGSDVLVRVYEGWSSDDLRALAQRVVSMRHCVVLLGSRAGSAHLVFAQSAGLSHDIPGLLREAAHRLGGRGGGKGNMAQGGSDNTQDLEKVIALVAREIPSGL